MSILIRFAFLALLLSAIPGRAEAQSSLFCRWFPSICYHDVHDGGGDTAAVPELDANTAGTAGALALGAALLLSTRRRRRER